MSNAVDLHNALRDAGYLPHRYDRNLASCPSEHYNAMLRLEEELGLCNGDRITELEEELETVEREYDKARDEVRQLEAHQGALEKRLIELSRSA